MKKILLVFDLKEERINFHSYFEVNIGLSVSMPPQEEFSENFERYIEDTFMNLKAHRFRDLSVVQKVSFPC